MLLLLLSQFHCLFCCVFFSWIQEENLSFHRLILRVRLFNLAVKSANYKQNIVVNHCLFETFFPFLEAFIRFVLGGTSQRNTGWSLHFCQRLHSSYLKIIWVSLQFGFDIIYWYFFMIGYRNEHLRFSDERKKRTERICWRWRWNSDSGSPVLILRNMCSVGRKERDKHTQWYKPEDWNANFFFCSFLCML